MKNGKIVSSKNVYLYAIIFFLWHFNSRIYTFIYNKVYILFIIILLFIIPKYILLQSLYLWSAAELKPTLAGLFIRQLQNINKRNVYICVCV